MISRSRKHTWRHKHDPETREMQQQARLVELFISAKINWWGHQADAHSEPGQYSLFKAAKNQRKSYDRMLIKLYGYRHNTWAFTTIDNDGKEGQFICMIDERSLIALVDGHEVVYDFDQVEFKSWK